MNDYLGGSLGEDPDCGTVEVLMFVASDHNEYTSTQQNIGEGGMGGGRGEVL